VLEAMAMGIPVVCSNIGFKGLGIESGEGAFMETDPAQFAARVSALLDSAELRMQTGTKGIDVIRNNFDWDVVTAMLDRYFEEVAAK
jgi:glycosyltransferase involved in cell wall biosynthesis